MQVNFDKVIEYIPFRLGHTLLSHIMVGDFEIEWITVTLQKFFFMNHCNFFYPFLTSWYDILVMLFHRQRSTTSKLKNNKK